MLRHLIQRVLLGFLAAVVVAGPAVAAGKLKAKGTRVAPVTAAYTWYPLLDKNSIPFHAGSGAWGAQTTLQEPAAPGVLTSVTITSLAQLQSACASGARTATITTSFTGGMISTSCNDVDIVINLGVVITSQLLFNSPSQRLRLRGQAVGTFSGGQVEYPNFGGGAGWADLIVDGIAITGTDADDQHAIQIHNGATRVAIVNNRVNAGASGYIGDATHIVFAGNSINTGAGPGNGSLEAWGIREGGAGPVVVFGNDIRTARVSPEPAYHRFRTAPPDNNHLSWVSGNTFVDLNESRIWWVNSCSANHTGVARGAWFTSNLVYTNGGALNIESGTGAPPDACGTPGTGGTSPSASYVRVNGNTIWGPWTVSNINIGSPADGDKTGNTFNAATGAPAWGAAGDPTSLDWTP